MDFYCPAAKLSVELDGFQHGLPEQRQRDEEREAILAAQGIEELRFGNHQWRANRDGVLLEISNALRRRTGYASVTRKVQNHRYLPPKAEHLIETPAHEPMVCSAGFSLFESVFHVPAASASLKAGLQAIQGR